MGPRSHSSARASTRVPSCARDRVRRRARLGALLLSGVLLGGCAANGAGPSPTPAIELTVASAAGATLLFLPEVVAAPADTPVRIMFVNASNQAHNLTFQAPISLGTRTIVEAGASEAIELRTPAPGLYPFVCTIHLGMSGTLTVT